MKRTVLAILIVMAVVCASAGTLFAQAKKAPATITLTPKVKAMAPVTFNHATHSTENKCDTCHATATGGALKTADAKPNAFHAAGAKAGLCIDCHATSAAAGKKTPSKCADCHKKA
jgi:c(7)-type cytochrome triheme protein